MPQPVPGFGQDHVFVKKKFAVMIEGSWMPQEFHLENRTTLEEQVGFLPMFPVPAPGTETATLMGGWMFGIPETSQNKDLAWEFLVSMLKPEHIAEFAKDGYLPTQVPIGEGRYSGNLRETIPYYDSMVSMLAVGYQRPNIPEYPQIAEHIRQAINQVYYGEKSPTEALDEAAKKSAIVLGWNT